MNFVTDANIVFSALIKNDGKIASVLTSPQVRHTFYSTNYLQLEIFKHKEKIIELSDMKEDEFLEHFHIVLKQIHFVNDLNISNRSLYQAEKLVRNVDVKDVSYVALSLELKCKLWTGDLRLVNGLRKIGFRNFITTEQILKLS